MTFTCKQCGANFERDHNGSGRRPTFCKACRDRHAREQERRWREENPDKVRAQYRRHNMRYNLRLYIDPELYAHHRATGRERRLRYDAHMREIGKWPKRKLCGGAYRPTPSRRFPDWATKGQFVTDARSAFLIENATPEMRAYARELFIERMERRRAAP